MVHLSREDCVTVMEEETIGMVAWNRFAKLLQGPGRHWMCGDVAMHDAPCSDLHQEEHIESSEAGGHYDQEIAGGDGLGVIANKRPPVLRRSPPVASSLRFGRPIGAHCAWRNIDAQLHRKLRCHARLAPSRILLCHLYDEFADVLRNSWPTSLRLPFPKQLETLAMPGYQSLWFDDDQGLFPIAEARPEDETDTGGVVQSSRLGLSSALRAVRERNRRRQKRSPSATRSVIKLSRESSERFTLGKNRDMGCQDGIRSDG